MFHVIFTCAIYIISAVFCLGMAGSAVVVLFSFFDDFTQLFNDEEIAPLSTRPPNT
jgi:hypothetical protein